jgi:HD-GYP domain-containing protein (c-di-GMP phosphodiesterase class II)
VEVIRSHHERFDGGGYPDGRKGEDIPLSARIFSVVDSFDAMTSNRPYRKALALDEALTRLRAEAGRQFDPDIVAEFELLMQSIQSPEDW